MPPQLPLPQDQPLQPREPRLVVWRNGTICTDCRLQELQDILQDQHALVWLDISGNDASQETILYGVFKLTPITIQTMREPKGRARLSKQERYFALVVHGTAFDIQANAASNPKLDIVFGQNFIITAHPEPLPWRDALLEAAGREGVGEHLLDRGMAFLLYALLDTLVDSYFPVRDDLDDIIDELEDVTANSTSNEVQVRIFRIKRSLAQMRRVTSPQVEVVNALVVRAGKLIPSEAQPYFAEVHDNLIRAFEVLDSYRDLMSGILDVYLAAVSNRLNVIMKQTAIIATIFLPISFVTGVFGQNFAH
jgi:magnesium transporter